MSQAGGSIRVVISAVGGYPLGVDRGRVLEQLLPAFKEEVMAKYSEYRFDLDISNTDEQDYVAVSEWLPDYKGRILLQVSDISERIRKRLLQRLGELKHVPPRADNSNLLF